MTIVVDIRPEIQAEIARQAALKGRAYVSCGRELLSED
jgi:hypothetical protein